MPLQFLHSVAQGLHIGGGAVMEAVFSPSDHRRLSHHESPVDFFCSFGLAWFLSHDQIFTYGFDPCHMPEAFSRNHIASFDLSQAGHM